MKHLVLFPLIIVGALEANNQFADVEPSDAATGYGTNVNANEKALKLNTQAESGSVRMAAAVFKAQEFCRAELKDFEFDARFDVVGATVYFSGAGFKNPEKGTITSSSLKPIRSLMERCSPGSIIIFDEVKVVGPDKQLRVIPGISLMLY